ncbi:hypothetical protein [Halobacillus litoralis]|uniref:hypothetical protein n=1 Tax=Halobacillus litoralis TaxID=45668 RepID=UPI001CD4129F|nr:hypothetical protein [Halobacillus litoralis]MCA1021034.1 hypothetical protein [Halobacillus litoralis]
MKKLSFIALFFVLLVSACSGTDVDQADQLEEPENSETETTEDEAASEETPSEESEEEAEPAEEEPSEETPVEEEPSTEEPPTEEEPADKEEDHTESDTTEAPEEEEEPEESAEPEEDTVESASNDSEDTEASGSSAGLKAYMPKGPMTKTFTQDEDYQVVHEVVDVNDRFVQQIVTFGDMVTLQILEFTEGRISVVHQESNPEDTSSQLDSFEAHETIDVLVDATGSSAKFQILDEAQTTSTPYGEFENVFVVQRMSGSDVTSMYHYAPDYGLIREKVEDKGDNGYTMTSELTEIQE